MKVLAERAFVKSHFIAMHYGLQFDCVSRLAPCFEFFLVDTSSDYSVFHVVVTDIVLMKFAHNRKKSTLFLWKSQ